jgi:PAT family beta-lactamase induction signal transducer AmpG
MPAPSNSGYGAAMTTSDPSPSTPTAKRMAVTLLHGFSSGLPLLAIGSTLQAWFTDEKVDIGTIGLFALAGTPYTLKFLWSPFLDRYAFPFLGRRRGWIFVAQVAVGVLLASFGFFVPHVTPWAFGALAVAVAFASASQDIVIDAYRRESLTNEQLALGSSLYVAGYRLAMLASGGLALYLADHVPWRAVYEILGALMAIGAFATVIADEPTIEAPPPRSLWEAVVHPFVEFLRRDGAWAVLLFVPLYMLGTNLATTITTPFYMGLGFEKSDIAGIVKTFGLVATITGGLAGGAFVMRVGTTRSLWILGVVQTASILLPVEMSVIGKSYGLLVATIAAENFSMGMSTSAYAAYLAAQTDKRYTATQYALLSALMGVPRTILSAPSGYIQHAIGWGPYYVLCCALALPGMLLLFRVAPWNAAAEKSAGADLAGVTG